MMTNFQDIYKEFIKIKAEGDYDKFFRYSEKKSHTF